MKLNELLEGLSFNELSNLALSNEGSGTIQDSKIPRLISATNSALLDIYSRFLLHEKELVLQTFDWKTQYQLKLAHAVSSGGSSIKYIMDTEADPFLEDIIHVIAVHDELGDELPVNDPEDCCSVFFPQPDTVQIPDPSNERTFFVRYKARHAKLQISGPSVLVQDVTVPLALENALRYKVAAHVFAPMAGQEYSIRVQSLEAAYELACREIESNGLLGPKELSSNLKLCRRGFP